MPSATEREGTFRCTFGPVREIFVLAALVGCGRVAFDPRDDSGAAALDGCVAQVASNGDQVCVRRLDGHVWCWGGNPVPSLMLDASDLASGEDTVCAIRTSGELRCWGAGTDGQIGDGAAIDRSVPVSVLQGPVRNVAPGQYHACATVDDGTGWCWGVNFSGALGIAPSSTRLLPVASPITDAVQLAVGDNFTCKRIGDGTVLCFGLNTSGELGDGTTTTRFLPAPVLLPEPAVEVAAGCHKHACAVGTSGAVYCWGENLGEQIGIGMATPFVSTPAQILGISDVRQVAVGYEHTCALTATDEIWCWGSNIDGQLGNGSFATASVPTRVTGLTGTFRQLEAACSNAYAVRTDGTLVGWGGSLLIGTGASMAQPLPIEIPIPCD
jgi:alpha-tubulin suppressor-like RCC1 family protein